MRGRVILSEGKAKDAVMLSAETASGMYPIEAVQMMVRIALETEKDDRTAQQPRHHRFTQAHAVSHAARALSEDVSVKAIIVLTLTGHSAHFVSKDRPRRPILAYTPYEWVSRQLALWWGIWPHSIELAGTTEELLEAVEQRLQNDRLIQKGEHIVIVGGMPVESTVHTNFVKLHRVGGY